MPIVWNDEQLALKESFYVAKQVLLNRGVIDPYLGPPRLRGSNRDGEGPVRRHLTQSHSQLDSLIAVLDIVNPDAVKVHHTSELESIELLNGMERVRRGGGSVHAEQQSSEKMGLDTFLQVATTDPDKLQKAFSNPAHEAHGVRALEDTFRREQEFALAQADAQLRFSTHNHVYTTHGGMSVAALLNPLLFLLEWDVLMAMLKSVSTRNFCMLFTCCISFAVFSAVGGLLGFHVYLGTRLWLIV